MWAPSVIKNAQRKQTPNYLRYLVTLTATMLYVGCGTWTGLPDGTFSYQKSQFRHILEVIGMEKVGILYDHLEYVHLFYVNLVYMYVYGYLVYFVVIWYFFPFWHVVPINIWQPWTWLTTKGICSVDVSIVSRKKNKNKNLSTENNWMAGQDGGDWFFLPMSIGWSRRQIIRASQSVQIKGKPGETF
jgi:hypothetical protein